jgi:hypothetical protein
MAMTIEVRQATDVPCTLIDLKNEETVKGYRSGRNWLLSGETQEPITEEYLINNIKLLISDGVFDGTQDDLLYWHVGFCLGVMSGKAIPQTEGE